MVEREWFGRQYLTIGLSHPLAAGVLSPQDLYVYISEHEHFTDFNVSSALFWQKRDLIYGDWTSGENADGCYEHYGEVNISQVGAPTTFWGGLRPGRGGSLRGLVGIARIMFKAIPGALSGAEAWSGIGYRSTSLPLPLAIPRSLRTAGETPWSGLVSLPDVPWR